MNRLMSTLIRPSRNRCRALVLLTAFTAIFCFAAPPWPWYWQYDTKVLVDNHNPQVSGGPAMAAHVSPTVPDGAPDRESEAVAVYVGEGGKNVWYSYAFLPAPLSWHGNHAIKRKGSGTILTSVGRPAITWIDTNNSGSPAHFMMVVPQAGQFETWRYLPDTWTQLRSGPIYASEQYNDGEPALTDGPDRTHLLIRDTSGNLLWFTKNHSYDDQANWVLQKLGARGSSPSMVSMNGTMFAIYWDTDRKAWIELTLKPGESAWESRPIKLNVPAPDRGAALVAAKGQLWVIYTAQGADMKIVPLNADGSLGTPGAKPQPISSLGNTAATKDPIGAAVMQSKETPTTVIVVHQGKSSKNLWSAIAR